MKLCLKVLSVLMIVVISTIITVNITKSVMGVGHYNSGEFKISKSSFSEWDSVFKNPGNIRVETLHTGDITVTMSGMINLKDPASTGIKEGKVVVPVLTHLVHHEKYGDFLIDTGFDSAYSVKPWGHFEGLAMDTYKELQFSLEKGKGTDEQLKARHIILKEVFLTHFHEHLAGAPALPDNIPYVFGKGEKETDSFPYEYSRLLKKKTDIRTIDFSMADEMPIVGKSADVFGDGSFWAISAPGHTKGHTSYLVNGVEGQYLITGDVCICQKGFEIDVESGTYSEDPENNRESFLKIKKLIDSYPGIKPIFGHESKDFRIKYE